MLRLLNKYQQKRTMFPKVNNTGRVIKGLPYEEDKEIILQRISHRYKNIRRADYRKH